MSPGRRNSVFTVRGHVTVRAVGFVNRGGLTGCGVARLRVAHRGRRRYDYGRRLDYNLGRFRHLCSFGLDLAAGASNPNATVKMTVAVKLPRIKDFIRFSFFHSKSPRSGANPWATSWITVRRCALRTLLPREVVVDRSDSIDPGHQRHRSIYVLTRVQDPRQCNPAMVGIDGEWVLSARPASAIVALTLTIKRASSARWAGEA